MWRGAIEELLDNLNKPKQPDLITKEVKGRWVAYFRSNSWRKGIGNTEKEALESLEQYYN